MSDLIAVCRQAVDALKETGFDGDYNLALLLEKNLKSPELRVSTPKGDLVVGVAESELSGANQAYVCLDNPTLGLVDLFLAEVPKEELLDMYSKRDGLHEGDIRMLSWEDIGSEDYTRLHVMEAADIEKQEELVKERENGKDL